MAFTAHHLLPPFRSTLKGLTLKAVLNTLDPNYIRARIAPGLRVNAVQGKDAGFNMIETLAIMALTATLLLAAMPQYQKYMERASVQNIATDLRNAAVEVTSDYSLKGSSLYEQADVTKSVANAKKTTGTSIAGLVPADKTKFTLTGTSAQVTNYTVTYDSSAGGVKIAPK